MYIVDYHQYPIYPYQYHSPKPIPSNLPALFFFEVYNFGFVQAHAEQSVMIVIRRPVFSVLIKIIRNAH
jgi:hypothetical protein